MWAVRHRYRIVRWANGLGRHMGSYMRVLWRHKFNKIEIGLIFSEMVMKV